MRDSMRLALRTFPTALILAVLSIPTQAATLSSVLLTWTAPPEGAEYITGYQVRWSKSADGSGAVILDAGNALELRVNDLPAEKVYFHVRAVDFLGQEGEWSSNTTRSVKPAIPATMGGLAVVRVELAR